MSSLKDELNAKRQAIEQKERDRLANTKPRHIESKERFDAAVIAVSEYVKENIVNSTYVNGTSGQKSHFVFSWTPWVQIEDKNDPSAIVVRTTYIRDYDKDSGTSGLLSATYSQLQQFFIKLSEVLKKDGVEMALKKYSFSGEKVLKCVDANKVIANVRKTCNKTSVRTQYGHFRHCAACTLYFLVYLDD